MNQVTKVPHLKQLPNPMETPWLDVPVAGRLFLGLGKDQSYRAVKRGTIPSIKISERRVVVPTAALWKMLGLDPTTENTDLEAVS